jgi:ABC-type multidrug transport system permease subunit
MEQYLNGGAPGGVVLELTPDRWFLEIYRTVIGTLQSDAWMLLLFYVFALIAYVILKGLDLRRQPKE